MKLFRWSVTLLYAAGIFYLSSRAWSGTPSVPFLDKIVHVCLYGGLGFLCAWSLIESLEGRQRIVILLAALLATAYGAADEIHQLFVPGRSAEAVDILANATGALCGAMLAVSILRRSQGRA